MRLRNSILTFSLLIALTFAALSAPAQAKGERLAQVKTWAFAIGATGLAGDLSSRYQSFDLIVVDGEEVSAAQVANLRASGTLVLGYLSVGTIERGRSWYRSAKPYRLGYWGDWDEWYANVSRAPFRRLIAQRVAPKMLAKGLDGLFLDNVDMIETHRSQRRPMRRLVGELSTLVHRRGGLLFAQNGASVISPMLKMLDGWNREDLGFTYSFADDQYRRTSPSQTRAAQAELRRIRARGLLTLATSYAPSSDANRARAMRLACDVGALPYVSNIWLNRLGPPISCDD